MTVIIDPHRALGLLANKTLLIFDFDGVLADSVDVKTEAFAELYRPHGPEVEMLVIRHHQMHGGMSRFDKFAYYEAEFLGRPASQERVDVLSRKFSDLVVDKVVRAASIPGAERFIERAAVKIHCAINSATPEQEIRMIVGQRGWEHYFCAIYGSPTTKRDNLQKLLSELEVSVEEALFFGDARSDWQAAKSLGMDFIGIGGLIGSILEQDPLDNIVLPDFLSLI